MQDFLTSIVEFASLFFSLGRFAANQRGKPHEYCILSSYVTLIGSKGRVSATYVTCCMSCEQYHVTVSEIPNSTFLASSIDIL